MDNRSMDFPLVRGIVKGGVIVPDRPLTEGTYAEVIIPNAPREIVERVRCRPPEAARTERRVIAGVAVEFGPDVPELLRHHDAEAAFTRLVEHAKTTLPEIVGLTTWVREDHEERGRFVIVCQGMLPPGHPADVLGRQRRAFSEGLRGIASGELSRLFHPHFAIAQE
jgi:hypothetical protein